SGRAARGPQRPTRGRAKDDEYALPNASTIVVNRITKPQKMKACMMPGNGHCRSLCWPQTTRNSLPIRAPMLSQRFSGLPRRNMARSWRPRRANRPTAAASTTVMRIFVTIARLYGRLAEEPRQPGAPLALSGALRGASVLIRRPEGHLGVSFSQVSSSPVICRMSSSFQDLGGGHHADEPLPLDHREQVDVRPLHGPEG